MPNIRPTVLLLDDFPDACAAVATWLEIEGWHPIATFSAEQALEVLRRRPVLAVVMEPHLYEGEAVHVARSAREVPFNPPLLVAMSARGRQGDQTAYEPTLFDFNLVKPVPLEQLGRLLAPLREKWRKDAVPASNQ